MLGTRNDIPKILQVLDVFILPSKYEGLPVVGVEAQAVGIPLLCSDKISRELKINKNVNFFPINNAEIWAKEIIKSVGNNSKKPLENIKEAGYDIKTTAKWLQAYYIKIKEESNR